MCEAFEPGEPRLSLSISTDQRLLEGPIRISSLIVCCTVTTGYFWKEYLRNLILILCTNKTLSLKRWGLQRTVQLSIRFRPFKSTIIAVLSYTPFWLIILRLAFCIHITMNPVWPKPRANCSFGNVQRERNAAAPWIVLPRASWNVDGTFHRSDLILFFKCRFQIQICKSLIKRKNRTIELSQKRLIEIRNSYDSTPLLMTFPAF